MAANWKDARVEILRASEPRVKDKRPASDWANDCRYFSVRFWGRHLGDAFCAYMRNVSNRQQTINT